MKQHGISKWLLRRRGRALLAAVMLPLLLGTPQLALAQFSDSYKFLDAVRKSDADAIIEALDQPGVTLVNTKDRSTGETALHITIARRDAPWTSYLLSHGARPELADNEGRSPLLLAVERRFFVGVELLLARKVNPDQANSKGETPLIRAAQQGDSETVRLLLAAGADPARRDSIAGMSAIDYAERDNRNQALVDLLKSKVKPPRNKSIQGPHL